MHIQHLIRSAGVVGAGGAGFPAHVKAGSTVEYIVANGAECEPLLHKDFELMVNFPERVVRGVQLLMEATGAEHGLIGIKEKNKKAVEAVSAAIDDDRVRIHLMGDFYPSGDEYVLVYEATGRLIPPQGIPLQVGVVVNNVETLYNISLASEGIPVTKKFITVTGLVAEPVTFLAPVGMSYRDCIDIAGGATTDDFAVFVSGIMMGKLETNLDLAVTKTTAGLILLPSDHTLVQRKSLPETTMHRIGKSACDQCSYCTELCPRYILGYDVQPHKVMRSLSFTTSGADIWSQFASLCCACGLCTLYACPEYLFPKEACDKSKRDMKEAGMKWSGNMNVQPHPMYEYRRTPLKQLMTRLGIMEFESPAHFVNLDIAPKRVEIPLAQHIGQPAHAVVSVGQQVSAGQLIGDVPEGKLGACVHSSIDGVVTEIGDMVCIESR